MNGWVSLLRSTRWLVLLAMGIVVLAATRPLWSTPYLMDSGDARMHLFRLFAFDQTIRQGVVYPRTLPNLAFGYGYPIFNYYPPLATYVAETLHILGLGLVNTIKTEFVLNFLIAASGVFVMTREFFAERRGKDIAAILAATVYIFAPYAIYDVYLRGATTEGLAAAMLPWLVWSLHLFCKRRNIGSLILVGIFLATLLFAHSLTLTLAIPFLAAYVLFELARLPASLRGATVLRLSGISTLAIGMGALYWLPFVAELRWVKFGAGVNPFLAAFEAHLLAPENLIQSSLLYRYDGPIALGLVTMGLAAFALLLAWHAPVRERSFTIFFGVMAFAGAAAMLKPIFPAWTAIPFATIIQFPWRLMVLVDLGLAVAIGALPILLSSHFSSRWREEDSRSMFQIGAALIIGVAVVYSTTANLSPRLVRYPRGEITLSHLARFEGYSGFAGTTSFDEFFPATMQSPIGFNQHLSESQASITNIQLVRYTPTERAFDVTASISTPITLRTFYFPDWQAEIDGFPARAYSHTPLGLLAVDVPAGNHRVVFHSVNTQAQTLGNLLSGASMLALLLLIGLAYRHRAAELPVILTALGIVLLSALIPTTVALTAPAFPIQSMQTQVTPSLEMIGLNIDAAKLDAHEWQVTNARDLLSVSVYWHVLDSVSDKPVFWKLTGNAFKSWSVTEQLPRFGSGFANAWIPNEIVEDHYELAIPAAMPAGRYELHVSYGDDRHFVPLTAIELTAGSPPAPPSPNIPRPINAQLGDRIKLLGSDAASVASAGENFPLTLFWRAERNVLDDYILFAQLLDLRGEAPVQHNAQPGIDFTPTSLWIPGRITTERLDLVLPSTLKPGIYTLITGLYGKPNQPRLPVFTGNGPADEDFVTLGEIRVPMNAQSAEPAHYLNFSLASNIRLLGYDLQTTRAQATLKLYWQAHTKIDADYKVFVHLVDATGQVAAQVDQFPGEGLYPTRIWEPGEKIIDGYDVSLRNLPPGKYTLVAGMYAPETGERLSVGDTGGNELPNRQIQIGSIDVAGQ